MIKRMRRGEKKEGKLRKGKRRTKRNNGRKKKRRSSRKLIRKGKRRKQGRWKKRKKGKKEKNRRRKKEVNTRKKRETEGINQATWSHHITDKLWMRKLPENTTMFLFRTFVVLFGLSGWWDSWRSGQVRLDEKRSG